MTRGRHHHPGRSLGLLSLLAILLSCSGTPAEKKESVLESTGPSSIPHDGGLGAGDDLSLFVVADTQLNAPMLEQISRSMIDMDPDAHACINVGDLTSNGALDQWEKHHNALVRGAPVHGSSPFQVGESMFKTSVSNVGDHIWYMGVPGNHDKYTADWFANWNSFMSGTQTLGQNDEDDGIYYAVMLGNTLLIILDSVTPTHAQRAWLEDILQSDAAKNATFKLAFFHYQVYPCNYKTPFHQGLSWVGLFEQHHVDVAFHGHAHTFERTCPMVGGECHDEGVIYLTSSGGPANTRQVWNDKVGVVDNGDREDAYECSKILDRYKGYWNHYSHVEVDGCVLTVSTYSYDTYMGKKVPFDVLTVNNCD